MQQIKPVTVTSTVMPGTAPIYTHEGAFSAEPNVRFQPIKFVLHGMCIRATNKEALRAQYPGLYPHLVVRDGEPTLSAWSHVVGEAQVRVDPLIEDLIKFQTGLARQAVREELNAKVLREINRTVEAEEDANRLAANIKTFNSLTIWHKLWRVMWSSYKGTNTL